MARAGRALASKPAISPIVSSSFPAASKQSKSRLKSRRPWVITTAFRKAAADELGAADPGLSVHHPDRNRHPVRVLVLGAVDHVASQQQKIAAAELRGHGQLVERIRQDAVNTARVVVVDGRHAILHDEARRAAPAEPGGELRATRRKRIERNHAKVGPFAHRLHDGHVEIQIVVVVLVGEVRHRVLVPRRPDLAFGREVGAAERADRRDVDPHAAGARDGARHGRQLVVDRASCAGRDLPDSVRRVDPGARRVVGLEPSDFCVVQKRAHHHIAGGVQVLEASMGRDVVGEHSYVHVRAARASSPHMPMIGRSRCDESRAGLTLANSQHADCVRHDMANTPDRQACCRSARVTEWLSR
uniref:Uncharacterized protein n=1 Tax=Sorangium cellulosum So0157-2 TaxID=1254432 RepID=A0A0G2YAV8_SORCE|nr:hypothetical protein [Sorangium cellulosum So0157-2]